MIVHSIESLAALDGIGLRCAVFLSGCPLRCVFCHNPDTWDPRAGKEYTPEELFIKIKRYKPYFKEGGGVTFSGGEPLIQAGEIVALGRLLEADNIGYALDTSGCLPLSPDVKKAVLDAEHVIFDLKFPDSDTMKRYTGGDFSLVSDFLDFLAASKKRTWVRTVIVPGINDSEEILDKYINILRPYGEVIEKYQLLAFHTMGFFKYGKLGINNPLEITPPLSPERLGILQKYTEKHLII